MVTNGKIPISQLQRAYNSTLYLAPGCAAAWKNFAIYVYERTGIKPRITSPDGAYRSYARQVYWYGVYRRYGHPIAAYPGTSSHGLGMAVDIANYTQFSHAFLVRAGSLFGFRFDTPSERWHMKFIGAANYKKAGDHVQSKEEDDEMAVLKNSTATKYRYAVSDGKFTFDTVLGTPAEQITRVNRKKKLYGMSLITVSPGEWLAELNDVNANRVEAGMPKIINPNG